MFVPGDRGGLTYGKTQTTITSGNLYLLIQAYCNAEDAMFASALSPFLNRLRNRDESLNTNQELKDILHQAGLIDPVMISEQDSFFDRVYWNPAVISAGAIGARTALGTAIVYDGTVHGSWGEMRDRTNTQFGRLADVGEHAWFSHYMDVRRAWLAGSPPSTLLPRTVYRMDSLKRIANDGNWELDIPLTVRGLLIDGETLTPVVRARPVEHARLLRLTHPFMGGADVKTLQEALEAAGIGLGAGGADGVFGPATDTGVREFQAREDLTVDGIVGAATRAALGIDVD